MYTEVTLPSMPPTPTPRVKSHRQDQLLDRTQGPQPEARDVVPEEQRLWLRGAGRPAGRGAGGAEAPNGRHQEVLSLFKPQIAALQLGDDSERPGRAPGSGFLKLTR